MLTFIIPACNEARLIASTIDAIHRSVASLSPPRDYEVIVVDDDSSDQTASIASDHQAVVVPSKCRNIGAARNLGFEASRGDPLVFVDADTLVDPDLLHQTWKALESGAVWGTARVTPSDACPLWVRFLGYFTIAFTLDSAVTPMDAISS